MSDSEREDEELTLVPLEFHRLALHVSYLSALPLVHCHSNLILHHRLHLPRDGNLNHLHLLKVRDRLALFVVSELRLNEVVPSLSFSEWVGGKREGEQPRKKVDQFSLSFTNNLARIERSSKAYKCQSSRSQALHSVTRLAYSLEEPLISINL